MIDDEKIFSDEQIGVDPNFTKKIERRKPISLSVKFVKKHKKLLIIIGAVLAVTVIVFFLIPEISINNMKLVNVGAAVRIEKGQTAKLKNQNVSVEIVNFVNDACPEGQTCFWSGQAVQYLLTIDDQKYATGSVNRTVGQAYEVTTESSDYQTYAVIKIVKPDEN